MTHTAICHQCEHPRTHRKPWLIRSECRECVQDFATRHRHATGHPVELNITIEPSIDRIRRPHTQTARIIERRGW